MLTIQREGVWTAQLPAPAPRCASYDVTENKINDSRYNKDLKNSKLLEELKELDAFLPNENKNRKEFKILLIDCIIEVIENVICQNDEKTALLSIKILIS